MLISGFFALTACETVDVDPEDEAGAQLALREVAQLLSEVGIGREQVGEVFDAVAASAEHGFDEEYMMRDIISSPGSGVRSDVFTTKSGNNGYDRPLRDLLREGLEAKATKADAVDVDAYLDALESSDIQIYWPYSENWDGVTLPVITFDPGDDSEANVGYGLVVNADGSRSVQEVLVDEELAQERPVWVVNRNDDCGLTTLEMRRLTDPGWGEGGGEIIVRPTAIEKTGHRMLVLRSITLNRNYDPWYAGGSELQFKVGSADGYKASTEAELKLYKPTITDFDMVIRRYQRGDKLVVNSILVSDWTDQIENCVLLITEDDGGTQTTWKCSIVAKYESKSYGLDVEIPYHEKDDIVWRGQLSRSYLEANSLRTGRFGEISLTFELVEY